MTRYDQFSFQMFPHILVAISQAGLTNNKVIDISLEFNFKISIQLWISSLISKPALYQQLIKTLIYLVITMPNISHVIYIFLFYSLYL